MPHIQSNGINICYEISGSGDPLLIISGTGADLRSPRARISAIDDHFKVFRYDQRGLGRTEQPPPPYSMNDYGDDAAALLSTLGVRQANIIGISFGGMVAQHLTHKHPNMVNKLVLACTSPGGSEFSSFDLRKILQQPIEIQGSSWLQLLDSRYQSKNIDLPIIDAVEELIAARKRVFPNNLTTGLINQLDARSTHDAVDFLPDLVKPTLIVGGCYDLVAPEKNQHRLNELIPNSEIEIFEGGHLFMLQNRSAWPRIASFLLQD
ncbi:MAG: alpha/beta hydrolase [Actinomycetota bacterium]